jgi:hypothetical protein
MEAWQLIFDDCFDLLFQILLLFLLSFDLLMLKWWLSAWRGGVHGGRLRMGCRLFRWFSGFWFLLLLDEAQRMFVVGWLFQGPDLWLLGMSLQSKSHFHASSWVFSRTHKWWAPMLGFDRRRLMNSNEEEKELRHSRGGNALRVTQAVALTPPPLEWGARAGLFIGGAQQSYYNSLPIECMV